jgi:hypothetical protein
MHEDVALCLLATDLQENSGKNSCKQVLHCLLVTDLQENSGENSCKQALERKQQFCCLLSRPSRKAGQSSVLLQATGRNNKSIRAPWIHA